MRYFLSILIVFIINYPCFAGDFNIDDDGVYVCSIENSIRVYKDKFYKYSDKEMKKFNKIKIDIGKKKMKFIDTEIGLKFKFKKINSLQYRIVQEDEDSYSYFSYTFSHNLSTADKLLTYSIQSSFMSEAGVYKCY